jgi:phage shock protein E
MPWKVPAVLHSCMLKLLMIDAGHVNIPWTSFSEYRARLNAHSEILGGLDRHLLVICMRGRRAGLLIEELMRCGYTNTHNCENPSRLQVAIPDVPRINVPNTLSSFDSHEEIRSLLAAGGRFIDVREPEEIEKHGDAFKGHINIPCSTFTQYTSRLAYHPELLGEQGYSSPLLVYCMRGRRAAMAKEFLDKCGFTNVHNCKNPEHIHAAAPEIEQVSAPNPMSTFAEPGEIRRLLAEGALLIDAREMEEIDEYKDAIEGHINIPWTSFGQFAARLHGDLIGAEGRPILVYCIRGRRAALLISALEQCGYSNLFNVQNVARIREAVPDIGLVAHGNPISPFLGESEIIEFMKNGNVTLVDCREPDEICADGSVVGHINIPWSAFDHSIEHEKVSAILGSDLSKPIFVFCSVGWRSGFLKKELESSFGYKNVFHVKNSKVLTAACDSLELTHVPNHAGLGRSEEEKVA